jgi:hypothetical protein
MYFNVFIDAPNDEQALEIATLKQSLSDLIDLWREVGPLEQHNLTKDLQGLLDTLKTLGVAVSAGTHRARLKMDDGKGPMVWDFLMVAVAPSSEPKKFALWDRQQPISLG